MFSYPLGDRIPYTLFFPNAQNTGNLQPLPFIIYDHDNSAPQYHTCSRV